VLFLRAVFSRERTHNTRLRISFQFFLLCVRANDHKACKRECARSLPKVNRHQKDLALAPLALSDFCSLAAAEKRDLCSGEFRVLRVRLRTASANHLHAISTRNLEAIAHASVARKSRVSLSAVGPCATARTCTQTCSWPPSSGRPSTRAFFSIQQESLQGLWLSGSVACPLQSAAVFTRRVAGLSRGGPRFDASMREPIFLPASSIGIFYWGDHCLVDRKLGRTCSVPCEQVSLCE
jgi:hypothetical protein